MDWFSGVPVKSIAACTSITLALLLVHGLQYFDEDSRSYPVQVKLNKITEFQSTMKSTYTNKSSIKILFWRPPFGVKKDYVIDKQQCGDCDYTYDTKFFEESDAIIVHWSEATPDRAPKIRNPLQFLIFFTMESPYALNVLRGLSFQNMNSYFNWTMSYRRDSDIYFPYVDWNKENGVFNGNISAQYSQKAVDDILSRKNGDPYILWMVGNCGSTHGATLRKQIVSEMEGLGLAIDKRGNCFGKPVPRYDGYLEFAAKYKFYLAFENALHCKDYISEKLWGNSLEAGVVPIVWGPKREDILAVAPEGSFIFYEDFASTKELVKYVQYLNSNVTAYSHYFNWRLKLNENYKYHDNGNKFERNSGICQLCRKLWLQRNYQNMTNVISSLDDWWTGTERSECLSRATTLH